MSDAVIGPNYTQEIRTRTTGRMKFGLVFLLPIVFLVEKDVFTSAPWFVAEHLYFMFSLLIGVYVLLNTGFASGFRVNVYALMVPVIICLNVILMNFVREDIAFQDMAVPTLNILYYIYLMMLFDSFLRTKNDIKIYIKGLEYGFFLVIGIFVLQMLVLLGASFADSINNALASIYEARWVPFKLMGDTHYFYSNGSYANTQERINGLSKEAPTFSVGLSLNFVCMFLALYATNKQRKYLVYTLICCVMLLTSRSSMGLFLGALTILIMAINNRNVFINILALTLVALSALAAADFLSEYSYVEKLFDLTKVSTQTRYGSVWAGIISILDAPFLGRGMAFYRDVYDNLPSWGFSREVVDFYSRDSIRVFALPVAIWGEFGFFIFMIILTYFFKLSHFAFSSKTKDELNKFYIRYFLIFLIVSVMSTSSYSHPFYFSSIAFAYVMWRRGRVVDIQKNGEVTEVSRRKEVEV